MFRPDSYGSKSIQELACILGNPVPSDFVAEGKPFDLVCNALQQALDWHAGIPVVMGLQAER